MSRTFATGIVVSAGLSLSVALLAQSQPEKPLSFEVASIHENMYGESRWFWTSQALASHGEASIVNAPLRGIIAQAYDINPLNERSPSSAGRTTFCRSTSTSEQSPRGKPHALRGS